MKNRYLLLLAVLLMALAASCGTGGDSTSNGNSAQPAENVLFEDDFAGSSGWEVGEYSTGSVGYEDGGYAVVSFGQGATMWGVANQSFSDTTIRVDARQVSAPANDNNDYGVICRVQPNGDGYYLLISGDGYYSILLGVGGRYESLVPWTTSDEVRQGNTTNQIMVICDGADLSLYANGVLLASASDSTFTSGDIALTATSYESGETKVVFDNLIVTLPE